MATLQSFITPIDNLEFGMHCIDLNVVKKSFSFTLETKKEKFSTFEQGQTITTLTVGKVVFSTINQTELDNKSYMLHHINDNENKAYLLLVSKSI
jgi:hypothetical protein